MTNIYSLNSLVNGTGNNLCEMEHKFYLYENSIFIFIKNQLHFYQKIKFYIFKISNDIFI